MVTGRPRISFIYKSDRKEFLLQIMLIDHHYFFFKPIFMKGKHSFVVMYVFSASVIMLVKFSNSKSQVATGFLRNTGMDPFEKQLDSLGPITTRGRLVQASLKYVDD